MTEIVSVGDEVVAWIEHYLVHGPGDIQGQPIQGTYGLDDERYRVILRMYRLRPRAQCADCGENAPPEALEDEEAPWRCPQCKAFLPVRRAVDEYLLSRPKGWSKSGNAGFIAAAEALAPVRFDGWRRDSNGAWTPSARPVRYPFIRCLATEEGQAGHTYRGIAFALHPETCSDVLRADYPKIDAGRDWQTSTRIFLPDGGEVRPSTASDAAKDGGKETHVVGDETHRYVLPELLGMYRTTHRNVFKRRDAEGWFQQTTTMFRPGQGSIAETTFAAAKAPDDETGVTWRGGLVVDHRQASRSFEDCATPGEVVAELRLAFGDAAAFQDLDRLAGTILEGRYDQADRFAGNRKTVHADDWCDIACWADGAAHPDRFVDHADGVRRGAAPPDGVLVTLGFDGSYGTSDGRIPDSTVLRGKVLAEGDWFGYRFTVGVWEADGDADWEPPFADVDSVVDVAFDRWNVWRLYADPAYWRDWINGWVTRHGEDRVIPWATHRDRQMGAALQSLHTELHTGDRDLSHDGDPRIHAHYRHARKMIKQSRSEDPEGRNELTLVRKETPRSANKIDGVVADALAGEAWGDGIAAGAHKTRERGRMVVRR